MSRSLKIGGALLASIVVLALVTLRLVGFEPQYLDPRGEEFQRNDHIAQPVHD